MLDSGVVRYADIEAFYDADSRRRRSPEADYGVRWTLPGSHRDRYRVSYCGLTGEIYAELQPRGLVLLLGVVLPTEDPNRSIVDPAPRYYEGAGGLDDVLAGWEHKMDSPGSLVWVRERIAVAPAPWNA